MLKKYGVTELCKDLLLKKFGTIEDKSLIRQWAKIISEFAAEAEDGGYSKDYIESKFTELLEATPSVQTPTKVFRRDALQRHHDYYANLFVEKNGALEWGDMQQYTLAMERENAGLANPFVPSPTS